MLPVKPWNSESVVRLFASIFLCYVMGSLLALGLIQYDAGKLTLRFLAPAAGAVVLLAACLGLLRRPWTLERFMSRLVIVALCFYGGVLLSLLAQRGAEPQKISIATMIIGLLCFQGASLVLIIDLLRCNASSWTEAFGFNNNMGRAILYGLIAACIFLPVGWLLGAFSTELLRRLPGAAPEEQQAVQALRSASGPAQILISGLATIVLAPVAEELLFRGVLYTWIRQLGFQQLALWLTSIIFAALHYNRANFLPLVILALVLAKLYDRTGNLAAPIAAHSLFNALNFTMLYVQQHWK